VGAPAGQVSSPIQISRSCASRSRRVLINARSSAMVPLRWFAVCSNLGFLVYGLLQPNLVWG
jgi:hypothetical protein